MSIQWRNRNTSASVGAWLTGAVYFLFPKRFRATALVAASVWMVCAHAQTNDRIFVDSFEFTSKLAAPDIALAAADTATWNTVKARCERDLKLVMGDGYAGFDWRQAAQDYGICYNVALQKGDAQAPLYSKKAVAVLKVLARSFPVINPNQNHQFLAFGDGATRTFALPMTPLAGTSVRVFVNTVQVNTFTYSAAPQQDVTRRFSSGELYPVLRISSTLAGATSNAPPQYTQEVDYHISLRDVDAGSNSQFNVLHWLGVNHPAGTYYVATITDLNNIEVASGNFTISATNLVFTTAPAVGQPIFVQYVGSDYTQTSNKMGGVESVKPDGPGFNMRAMNPGLAYGYDAMRQSPDMTTALRQEFYGVLNSQVDWYTQTGYEGPNLGSNAIGNYYIRGYLTGAVFTAYGTDSDNPRALTGGDMKPLARSLLMATFNRMAAVLPGGYGPQGTYSEGTNQDILQLFDLWKRVTATDGVAEDLAPQLEWDANLVPATIHGTKPNRTMFYDGGDWNDMPPIPAKPLVNSMKAFIKYQPTHPMVPFARQLLSDVGSPVAGAMTDYKTGAGMFPLSYLAKYTGPIYARSDWGTGATWLSFAAGPVFMDHQHQDQGHFTIQRGADYLLINAGGYGIFDTVPWHNTLGFDDRGAGNLIVYPPGQGNWGSNVRMSKYVDGGTFVYGQSDIGNAYVNNDGVRNSVTRAVRTLVYIRPDIIAVHDRTLTANANVKKYFSLNFGGALVQAAGVYSSTVGQSKLFMRSLKPANPTPTILPPGTQVNDHRANPVPISGTNYQIMAVGQTADNFLHLFQVSASTQSTMATSVYMQSADVRAEGVEVNAGARRWIIMNAAATAPIANTSMLAYGTPQACPCTHVVGDLMPSTVYHVTIVGGAGGTITVSTNVNGVLTFVTDDPATTGVQIL